MAAENLALFVATYDDATTALADYQQLEDVERSGRVVDEGSVMLSRTEDGNVVATATGEGLLCPGPLSCRDSALVVGLFIPPLLLTLAVGANVDLGIVELVKKYDAGKMGVAIENRLARGSSSIAVLLGLRYLSGVARALSSSDESTSTVIDWDDYCTIDRVISMPGITTLQAS